MSCPPFIPNGTRKFPSKIAALTLITPAPTFFRRKFKCDYENTRKVVLVLGVVPKWSQGNGNPFTNAFLVVCAQIVESLATGKTSLMSKLTFTNPSSLDRNLMSETAAAEVLNVELPELLAAVTSSAEMLKDWLTNPVLSVENTRTFQARKSTEGVPMVAPDLVEEEEEEEQSAEGEGHCMQYSTDEGEDEGKGEEDEDEDKEPKKKKHENKRKEVENKKANQSNKRGSGRYRNRDHGSGFESGGGMNMDGGGNSRLSMDSNSLAVLSKSIGSHIASTVGALVPCVPPSSQATSTVPEHPNTELKVENAILKAQLDSANTALTTEQKRQDELIVMHRQLQELQKSHTGAMAEQHEKAAESGVRQQLLSFAMLGDGGAGISRGDSSNSSRIIGSILNTSSVVSGSAPALPLSASSQMLSIDSGGTAGAGAGRAPCLRTHSRPHAHSAADGFVPALPFSAGSNMLAITDGSGGGGGGGGSIGGGGTLCLFTYLLACLSTHASIHARTHTRTNRDCAGPP